MILKNRFWCPLVLIVMLLTNPATCLALEIIAHRGASFDAPENTLASFKQAFEQQAEASEVDIHLTKDGKIIVIHDSDMKRTGGSDMKISEHTLAELQRLNVGQFEQWKGKNFNEKAPTLSECLALLPPGKRIYIEIKVGVEILPALEIVFKNSPRDPKDLPIITFNYEVARAAKAKFPAHRVLWLRSWSKDKVTGQYPDIDDLIRKAREAKLDGLNLNYQFPIDRELARKVRAARLKLYTWTIDDPAVAQAHLNAGVDGITTNRPQFLRQKLTP